MTWRRRGWKSPGTQQYGIDRLRIHNKHTIRRSSVTEWNLNSALEWQYFHQFAFCLVFFHSLSLSSDIPSKSLRFHSTGGRNKHCVCPFLARSPLNLWHFSQSIENWREIVFCVAVAHTHTEKCLVKSQRSYFPIYICNFGGKAPSTQVWTSICESFAAIRQIGVRNGVNVCVCVAGVVVYINKWIKNSFSAILQALLAGGPYLSFAVRFVFAPAIIRLESEPENKWNIKMYAMRWHSVVTNNDANGNDERDRQKHKHTRRSYEKWFRLRLTIN